MRHLRLVLPFLVAALAWPANASAAQTGQRFDDCGQLLSFAKRGTLAARGGVGMPVRVGGDWAPTFTPPIARRGGTPMAAPEAPAGSAGSGAEGDSSGTNNQEAGVDEPDIVKADADRVLVLQDSFLEVFTLGSGGVPRRAGRVAIEGYPQALLVRGDTALVTSSVTSYGGGTEPGPATDVAVGRPFPAPGEQKLVLTQVDIGDPAAPSIRRTLTVDGTFVAGRLTGTTARVVVSSTPDPIAVEPQEGETFRAALRRQVSRTGTRRFIPRAEWKSRVTGNRRANALVPCTRVYRPRKFSGTSLITVLTIDMDKGLFGVGRESVMSGAEVVYASPTSLVIGTTPYDPRLERGLEVPERLRTDLLVFDAGSDPVTRLRATGSVAGTPLNSFSFSEYAGVLRVATTEEPAWFGDPGTAVPAEDRSESFVTTLRERGGRLEQIGRVGGLGRGERIYAVRFIGDVGYVVTFRQVDPLYTIDLADPANPRVLGELKIPGYSAYLHPIGDDLLMGVGVDATEEGRRLGAQISVFDVSNLRAPKRLWAKPLGDRYSSTEVEYDHKAFLWWPKSRLAVIPVSSYDSEPFQGAIAFRAGRDGLTEVGRLQHPAYSDDLGSYRSPIRRSLVAGGRLVTVSDRGVGVAALDTLTPIGFAEFPVRPAPEPQPGEPEPQPAPAPGKP